MCACVCVCVCVRVCVCVCVCVYLSGVPDGRTAKPTKTLEYTLPTCLLDIIIFLSDNYLGTVGRSEIILGKKVRFEKGDKRTIVYV